MSENKELGTATFGGGCFWCTEAVFQDLRGVDSVLPGYSGGHLPHPSYEQVCTGATGHAEVVQIRFDPSEVSYAELLRVFFATHDPTTPDRQGDDIGPQYRSVIFWHDEAQKAEAEKAVRELEEEGIFGAPIVTQIVPFEAFYEAEAYHRNYFRRNPGQPYCQAVIAPKVAKFRKANLERLVR